MRFDTQISFAKDLAVGDVVAFAGATNGGSSGVFLWGEYPTSDPDGIGSAFAGHAVVSYTAVVAVVGSDETGVDGDGVIPAVDVTFANFDNSTERSGSRTTTHYRACDIVTLLVGNVLKLAS